MHNGTGLRDSCALPTLRLCASQLPIELANISIDGNGYVAIGQGQVDLTIEALDAPDCTGAQQDFSDPANDVKLQFLYTSCGDVAVRNVGNFNAHAMKSTNGGEIIGVEAGEAEWRLDVLESLFDYCFVRPLVLHEA